MGSNVVVPFPVMGRDEVTGQKVPPQLTQIVLVSNPADCERLARSHVQKQSNFTSFLFGSVLSTTDARNWQHQRESFNLAFLPRASLAKVFPVSLARAKCCADRLAELGQNGAKPVQVTPPLRDPTGRPHPPLIITVVADWSTLSVPITPIIPTHPPTHPPTRASMASAWSTPMRPQLCVQLTPLSRLP